LAASGTTIAYADADMNVAPGHLHEASRRLQGGADLVAGRRELSEYAAAEGPLRLLAGGLVQLTRRLVVMSAIRDTQCGFKVFRRELARSIFARTRIRSFAFDIEVLFVARKLGACIVEMPVSTTYRAESTFSIRKHLPQFLKDIVQIRLNDLAGRYRE
jgi:dolichyl-phosphate beta-glucosyltransferase